MVTDEKQSTIPPVPDKILSILPSTAQIIRIAGLFAFLFVLVTACSQIQPVQTDETNAQKRSETVPPTPQYAGSYTSIAEIDSGQGPTLTWKRILLAEIEQNDYSHNRLIYDGQRFFLLADNHSYVSIDGESWNETELRLPWNDRFESSAAAYNGLVVMATSRPEIITWSIETNTTHQFTPSIVLEEALEYPTDLRNTVAAGQQGILVTYFVRRSSSGNVAAAYYSRNGQDWTRVDPEVFDTVQYPSIVAFKDGFLILSSPGSLRFSADGLSWNDISQETNISPKQSHRGLTPWGENVLAFSMSAYTGPSIGFGSLMVLTPKGKHNLPESGLSPLQGNYIGLGGHLDANQMGIVAAFGWDPHLPAKSGCCSEGQVVGVVEFSPDGITWTRRQFPEQVVEVLGLAVGKDRVLMLTHDINNVPSLWVGFPDAQ
jgi:hypothetical protein